MKSKLKTGLKTLTVLFLVGALTATGCGKGSDSSGDTSSENTSNSSTGESKSDSKELKKVIVGAGNTSVSTATEVIAYYAGYFEEEGLDVELTPLNTNADLIAALTTKKVDWGAGGGTIMPLCSDEEGEEMVVISGNMTEGAALVALPENVDSLKKLDAASLKGKKFGTTRTTTGDIALRSYLLHNNVDLDTIEFIDLGDANTVIQAVKNGEVDFGNVFMTYRSTAVDEGLEIVAHVDDYFPGAPCCRTWANKSDIEADRDLYVSLLRAQIKAYRVYKTDKEKTKEYLKNYIEVDDKIIDTQLYDYGHLGLSPDPGKKVVEDFYETSKEVGFADGSINVDDYIDTTIYKDALDSLLKEEPDDEVYKELLAEYEKNDA